jgi:hypothetical protein
MAICLILWPFGAFYCHLVYFFPFWYDAPRKIWQPWLSLQKLGRADFHVFSAHKKRSH